jgi:hypothetical protein
MDTSHILQPTANISYSFFSKVRRFFAAALLADWVLGNAVYVFINHLNRKGLLGLGEDFKSTYIIWGNSIWTNILHVFILGFIASLFGFIFGYLSRRISLSDKIIFTTFYVFIRFVFLGLFALIVDSFIPTYSANWHEILSEWFLAFSSSVFNATFVIVGFIVMFFCAIYFMNIGSKIISNPYYTSDKKINGTLFDIKWYHYFWLFIPISIYSQVIFNLLYITGNIIYTLIQNFKWTTIFGGDDGEKGNAINVAWYSFIVIAIAASIVMFLMFYLREILIGKTSHNWAIKAIIILGISFVIPFLILRFTGLAGS